MNYVNPVSLFCILNLFLITNYLVKKCLNLSQISINLLQKKNLTNFMRTTSNQFFSTKNKWLLLWWRRILEQIELLLCLNICSSVYRSTIFGKQHWHDWSTYMYINGNNPVLVYLFLFMFWTELSLFYGNIRVKMLKCEERFW